MFLGVVANSIPSKNFDGKIYLHHVSEEKAYAKTTYNQNFCDDASVSGLLKNARWIKFNPSKLSDPEWYVN